MSLTIVWRSVIADHPTIAFGSESSGPVGTISTVPLPTGKWAAEFRTEYINFNRFSDSELAGLAMAGEEDAHSVDTLLNASVSLTYGVAGDLTVSARVPYVNRKEIRKGEIDEGFAGLWVQRAGIGSAANRKRRLTGGD